LDLTSDFGSVTGIPICAGACGGAVRQLPGDVGRVALAPPPARRLTICTGILYDVGLAALPGELPLLTQWVEYHLSVGVENFFIYDADGSAGSLLADYIASGAVTYFPRWPASLSENLDSVVRDCKSCLNMHMNAHCVSKNKGLSRWVLFLHGFDTYLAAGRPAGAGRDQWSGSFSSRALHMSTMNIIDALWEHAGTIAISMIDFGGPPLNSSWVIGRFGLRQGGPITAQVEMARGADRESSWLNHFGTVMVNPDNVLGLLDHWSRSRPGSVDVEVPWEFMRVNHYVDALRPRCLHSSVPCEVPDYGMLENLRILCDKLGQTRGENPGFDHQPAC